MTIVAAQSLEEGERQIEYMRNVYKEMQLNLQPLVIAEPGGIVIVYDDYRLLSESLVKGIDICFKLIQVCQCFISLRLSRCFFEAAEEYCMLKNEL